MSRAAESTAPTHAGTEVLRLADAADPAAPPTARPASPSELLRDDDAKPTDAIRSVLATSEALLLHRAIDRRRRPDVRDHDRGGLHHGRFLHFIFYGFYWC